MPRKETCLAELVPASLSVQNIRTGAVAVGKDVSPSFTSELRRGTNVSETKIAPVHCVHLEVFGTELLKGTWNTKYGFSVKYVVFKMSCFGAINVCNSYYFCLGLYLTI